MNGKKVKEIYDTYKDYNVNFNKSVTQLTGLIANKISIKCDSQQVPAILISTSLSSAKVIVKLGDECLNVLKKNNFLTTIRYTFYIKESMQNLSFYVNSKITNYDIYDSDKPNLYLVSLDFTRMPATIFIEILGEYILNQESKHERAVERLNITSSTLESFLFKDGNGKKCSVTELSIFSAKVLLCGQKNEYPKDSSVLLIMKSKELEGLGEMLGSIIRVEEIQGDENILAIIVLFDQEQIPPAYKLWVSDCIMKSM